MSGIKENQEVTSVRKVTSTPVKSVSISRANGVSLPNVVETTVAATVVLIAPHLINLAFTTISKAAQSQTLSDLKQNATETTYLTLKQVSIASLESANQIAVKISQIQDAKTVEDIKQTCVQIKEMCIKEQVPAYKNAISQTVKQVMIEVGFPSITVKTIGSTPVIIAKNAIGQTLRTEITADSKGKIDLIRIQSGIQESECDSLNTAINTAFKKHGLEYTRFSKTATMKNQVRKLDLSDTNQCEQNDFNQINLKR